MPDDYTLRERERALLDREKQLSWARFAIKVSLGTIALFVVLWLLVGLVGPQLNRYRAETERRAIVAGARAEADAAEYTANRNREIADAEADVDRTRAQGTADANEIISASLTPEYIHWYFVDKLDDINGQIIYVPTDEAGIPLPEAGRAVQEGEG